MIRFLLEKMQETPEHEAFVSSKFSATYKQILESCDEFLKWLKDNNIPEQAVVSFDGDYSLQSIALFLALARNNNKIVPLSRDSRNHFTEFREIASTEYDIALGKDHAELTVTGRKANHEIYDELQCRESPGLVLFSSGSTGKSKAIVQDLNKLIEKFRTPRKPLRMLIFLQLDHIGGVNSLLYSLANNGTIIVSDDRKPVNVCRAIETYQAELLPTSPTFLNLLLLSKAHEEFDLSSLKLITYGTEPMQKSTLENVSAVLPNAALQQTYGLSEVGIMRSKSQSSDSLWMKIGGEEFTTKIVNGTLWIKSDSAMLGYLNAPDPFDEEGFLDTGDLVEQDGEWIRILGRQSEIINVGGYKVFPTEVESVLLEMENVEDVVIFGENHPITGKIVAAKFKLQSPETLRELKMRVLRYCRDKLQSYKMPGKIYISDESTYNERFKRMRRLEKEWK